MSRLLLVLAALAASGCLAFGLHRFRMAPRGPVVHVENRFRFTVPAPPAKVLPLFGAWGEKAWAGEGWKPAFLHPLPPRDVAGEVFTVSRHHGTSVWVNTALDLELGFVQYVYVIPGVQAVLITLRTQSPAPGETLVEVDYQRTALDPRHNAEVERQGRQDAASGPEWGEAVAKAVRR